MARRIEHRSEFGYPAERVYAALTDESCLRERLARIGGRQSELVSFATGGHGTTAVMRQSIDAEYLPTIVRRVTPEGVTIDRVERWLPPGTGYGGTVEASVHGFSGSLHGTTAVTDASAGAGSLLVLAGEVKVGIPLVGGKIEIVIAEQLGRLLRAEARFTERWLESR